MYIQPLIEGQYFHIYNRGVNGEDIFKEQKNYYFFLQRYQLYCSDAIDTLAYCLLKNHFHLVVRIKENVEVPRRDGKEGMFRISASKQLGHFFNLYTQSINRLYKRTGPLFESPFERKIVDDESYLMSTIYYCHRNPVHHGFVNDLRDWEFSSYHSILNNSKSIVAVDEVIKRFRGADRFEEAHKAFILPDDLGKYFIENSSSKQPPTGSSTAVGVAQPKDESHS